jgi:hypothetical protein
LSPRRLTIRRGSGTKTGKPLGEPLRHEVRLLQSASARADRALSPHRLTKRQESGTQIPARGKRTATP